MTTATWILVLFFHVGVMGDGNSNTSVVIPGFETQKECNAEGSRAKVLTAGTVKETTFVCLRQTKTASQ